MNLKFPKMDFFKNISWFRKKDRVTDSEPRPPSKPMKEKLKDFPWKKALIITAVTMVVIFVPPWIYYLSRASELEPEVQSAQNTINDLRGVRIETQVEGEDGKPVVEYVATSTSKAMRDEKNNPRSNVRMEYRYFADIDPEFLTSVIAVEDANRSRFYHIGVDPRGVGRSLQQLFNKHIRGKQNERVGGGSTLEMQIMKSLYLKKEKTFDRKTDQMIMAYLTFKNYDEMVIQEMYFNIVYLGNSEGHRLWGFESASRSVFGTSISDKHKDQWAYLIATLPAPECLGYFQSKSCPGGTDWKAETLKRYNMVLGKMLGAGVISPEEHEAFKDNLPMIGSVTKDSDAQSVPFFTEQTKKQVMNKYPTEQLGRIAAESKIDPKLTQLARNALQETLEPLQKQVDNSLILVVTTPGGKKTIAARGRVDIEKLLKKATVAEGATVTLVMTTSQKVLATGKENIQTLLPKLLLDGAVVILDSASGVPIVYVGGSNYGIGPGQSQLDRVTDGADAIGSIKKIPMAIAAIGTKEVTAASYFPNQPVIPCRSGQAQCEPWPKNFHNSPYGGDMPLWDVIRKSMNAPAAHLAMKRVDGSTILFQSFEFTEVLGIPFPDVKTLSPTYALGIEALRPIQVAELGALIANDGIEWTPRRFWVSLKKDGVKVDEVVKKFKPNEEYQQAVVAVREIMRLVARPGGTAGRLATTFKADPFLSTQLACKTGSSRRTGWLMCSWPKHSMAIRIGFDEDFGKTELTGGGSALLVAEKLLPAMKKARPDLFDTQWKSPSEYGLVPCSSGGTVVWLLPGTEGKAPGCGEISAPSEPQIAEKLTKEKNNKPSDAETRAPNGAESIAGKKPEGVKLQARK